ncbi:hypothetical protein [Streptomyces sp. NRRL F-2747]|uniref:hypothetical protein n=1 Tax=Streptomyces sp. NRRL F-2747 TaxID=1463843 RepID=UPI000AF0BC10|nr:hypothetical protein [Streptomyces sp. NRRL F-2747]
MRGILRHLVGLFHSTPPVPPSPVGPPDEDGEDWWEPSWIWVAGDLDEQGDR